MQVRIRGCDKRYKVLIQTASKSHPDDFDSQWFLIEYDPSDTDARGVVKRGYYDADEEDILYIEDDKWEGHRVEDRALGYGWLSGDDAVLVEIESNKDAIQLLRKE